MKSSASTSTDAIGLLQPQLADLTPRERKFLLLLTEDVTNSEITERLFLTLKSVENYKTKIGGKLNITGRDKLAKFARKHTVEIHRWHKQYETTPPPP